MLTLVVSFTNILICLYLGNSISSEETIDGKKRQRVYIYFNGLEKIQF